MRNVLFLILGLQSPAFTLLFHFDIAKIYTKACTLYCIVLIINFFLTIELISIAIKKSRKLAVNLDYYGF